MDCYINVCKPTEGEPSDAIGVFGAALEDTIMRKGWPAKAGSKILDAFVSPFDATVVARLLDHGIGIVGRARMNEFGLPPLVSREAGDRCDVAGATDAADAVDAVDAGAADAVDAVDAAGAADAVGAVVADAVGAVAAGAASFALCNDIFGIYRRRAAEAGLCYLHPTYGTVSRYGLIPLACSMDQIGIVCKQPADGFHILSVVAGNDPKDGAMFPETKYAYAKTGKTIRVGVPAAVVNRADEGTRASIRRFVSEHASTDIELKFFDIHKQVMYILACAEASSNLMRYDGVKFGHRSAQYRDLNELYVNTRTEALGVEAKLASIMGFMVLSQGNYGMYYEKAMKLRRLIKESLRFDEYDVIALPATLGGGPYEDLSLYALAPLAGLPSVSFSFEGHGMQLVAGVKNENALLTALAHFGEDRR